MPQSKLILIAILLFAGIAAHAQSIGPSALDAAGNSATAGGITYEYAIGQVVAGNTLSSSTLVVTPGVLQPAATTGVRSQEIAAANLQIFPSPVETTLFLQPAFNGSGTLQYGLYDAAGKLVLARESKLVSGTERQTLEVAQIAAGQYMLQVSWQQAGLTYSASYKVQKLK